MNLFAGVTDSDWYELLASQPGLDEVNFWQPGGNHQFRALVPGELFLFKLHSPNNFIVGGGVFAHASLLPTSLAWESFGIGNGATTLVEMRTRIEKYRRRRPDAHEDYRIGCIILTQPFFLPRDRWIPVPASWHPNIVQGKTYANDEVEGRALWQAVQDALQRIRADAIPLSAASGMPTAEPAARFGQPTLLLPRLGQGSFRVLVTDAYDRRCAVTKERTLPVLEAAHIRPYADGGEHRIDNGLLLRRDLHTLFDRGYVSQGDRSQFRLKVLGGEQLARLLSRKEQQNYYRVPWPVADYDSTASILGAQQLRDVPPRDERAAESGPELAADRGGSVTGVLRDLVEICRSHSLDEGFDAIVRESYVPFLPGRGRPGTWNRVLVLGEAQNLSSTYDHYVKRLLEGSPRERILRLYWEAQIHVKPWDDGTLKLAMAAAFGCKAEQFAVSNAVLWSTKQQDGNNETPGAQLQNKSREIWNAMLPLLDATHVVTTGRVAGDVIACVRADLGAQWTHVRLCSASPLFLARQAAKADENELLERYPRIAELARQHPEYVASYRRNRIYFAAEAIRAVAE